MDRGGNDKKRLLQARLLAITLLLSQLEESDTGTENGSDNGSVVSQQSTAAAAVKPVTTEAEPPATCSTAQKVTEAAEQVDNKNVPLATLDTPLRRRQQTRCLYAAVPVNIAVPGIDIGQNSRFSPGHNTDETNNRSAAPAAVESPTDPWIPSPSVSGNENEPHHYHQQPPPIKSSSYSNTSFLLESPLLHPTSSSSNPRSIIPKTKAVKSLPSSSSSALASATAAATLDDNLLLRQSRIVKVEFAAAVGREAAAGQNPSPATSFPNNNNNNNNRHHHHRAPASQSPSTPAKLITATGNRGNNGAAVTTEAAYLCSHHSPRIDAAVRRERQKTTAVMHFTSGLRTTEGSQYFDGGRDGGGRVGYNNYVDGIVRPTTGTGSSILNPRIEHRTHCINNSHQSSRSRTNVSFVQQTPPPEYHATSTDAHQKFRGEDRVISSSTVTGGHPPGTAGGAFTNGGFGDFEPLQQSPYRLRQGGDCSSSGTSRPLAAFNHNHQNCRRMVVTGGDDEAPIWKLQENCSDGDSGHLTGSDGGGSGPDLNLSVVATTAATPSSQTTPLIITPPAHYPSSSTACPTEYRKSILFSNGNAGQSPKASEEAKKQAGASKSSKISPDPIVGQNHRKMLSSEIVSGPRLQSSANETIVVDSSETDCLLVSEEAEEVTAGVTNSNSSSSDLKVTTV